MIATPSLFNFFITPKSCSGLHLCPLYWLDVVHHQEIIGVVAADAISSARAICCNLLEWPTEHEAQGLGQTV